MWTCKPKQPYNVSTMSNDSEYVYYEYEEYPDWEIDRTMLDKGEIYLITNLINDKIYIGQAQCWNSQGKDKFVRHGSWGRFRRHISEAFSNSTSTEGCKYLNAAIRKHGFENFAVEILCRCPKEYLNENEIYFIGEYDARDPSIGYNLAPGGYISPFADPVIRKKASETNKKSFQDPIKKASILEKRKKTSDQLAIMGKVNPNKTSDLPKGIYLYERVRKDRNNAVQKGYGITISYQNEKRTAYVISNKLTMDQKYEIAKKKLNQFRVELGLEPFTHI
ncbi:hypothetical protein BNJ_00111 [Kaumoebavirus]|uniref:hypothetical protein n=1 Tax=Kaumoebavirus TaxID=1859492 RepID=UPI0009C3B2C5|nr:hypothetical protein BNJ_00111 [Kaumoebavirus]ARA71946.1 hypothetical protein BNJ_00111 [Kaumoebavirus]